MSVASEGPVPGQAAGSAGREPQEDVVVLAGDRLLPEGLWLLVTEVDAAPGGVFTGIRLPPGTPRAAGGDVVLRLAAGAGRLSGTPSGHVQVYAVVASTLVLVAEWGMTNSGDWSEVVRVTTAFTMGALAELEERGADLRSGDDVDLEAAAPAAAAGLPALAGNAPSSVP